MAEDYDIRKKHRGFRIEHWLIILLIAGLYFLLFFQHKQRGLEKNEDYYHIIDLLNDSISESRDSVDLLNLKIIKNRHIEDSLQERIAETLDSLELFEGKLRFMQDNSEITKEVVLSVLDSIDFYRKKTVSLKKEIDQINRQTASLLLTERKKNRSLREKIESYERRLMGLFAINLSIQTFRDGHDANSRLIVSDKARRITEVHVTFKLTRDLAGEDKISLELLREKETIMTLRDINTSTTRRKIKRSFHLDKDMTLKPGEYSVVVYHENSKYEIDYVEIGRGVVELR